MHESAPGTSRQLPHRSTLIAFGAKRKLSYKRIYEYTPKYLPGGAPKTKHMTLT